MSPHEVRAPPLPQPQTSGFLPASHPKSNTHPGKKRPSASHNEDYLSDDGFVADGSHDGGPKKKAKTATNKPRPLAKGKSGEEESWEVGAPGVSWKSFGERGGRGVEGRGKGVDNSRGGEGGGCF